MKGLVRFSLTLTSMCVRSYSKILGSFTFFCHSYFVENRMCGLAICMHARSANPVKIIGKYTELYISNKNS